MGLFNRRKQSRPDNNDRTANQCITFMQFVEYITKKREYAGYSTSATIQLSYFVFFACFFCEHKLISRQEKDLIYDRQSKTVPLITSLLSSEVKSLLLHFDDLYTVCHYDDRSPADATRLYLYAVEKETDGDIPEEFNDLVEDRLNITAEAVADELLLLRDALS